MGQYHFTVNLTKREFIHPHELGNGLKLAEFAFGDDYGGISSSLILLLACSNGRGGGDMFTDEKEVPGDRIIGRWAGDRIAVVGDYAVENDLQWSDTLELWDYFGIPGKIRLTAADIPNLCDFTLCHLPKFLQKKWPSNEASNGMPLPTIDIWSEGVWSEGGEKFVERVRFTDISDKIRKYWERNTQILYLGEGWLYRTSDIEKLGIPEFKGLEWGQDNQLKIRIGQWSYPYDAFRRVMEEHHKPYRGVDQQSWKTILDELEKYASGHTS